MLSFWLTDHLQVDISEQLEISVSTAYQTVYNDLAFSKISYCWISPGQCKNSGNYQMA